MPEYWKEREYYTWAIQDFDEERDLKFYKVWAWDMKDCVPPMKPFMKWGWGMGSVLFAMEKAAETLCLPGSKGLDGRFIEGYMFLCPAVIRDEEERKQREPLYRERIAPYIEDFGGKWAQARDEIMGRYQRFKETDPKKLSNVELLYLHEDYIDLYRRSWDIHMLFMYSAYPIYGLFDAMCQELLGIDEQQPKFKLLMSGFDNALFRANRALWRLGSRAMELGLDRQFRATGDDEELLAALKESEPGRKWLQELDRFLPEHGWRAGLRAYDETEPSWIEKPSRALPDIKQAMLMMAEKGPTFTLDQERERLAQEREEAEREIISGLPEEKRDWFGKLMRAAQWSGQFSEDHNYYLDMYTAAIGRHVAIEIGNRFTKAGVIADPEDIFFLTPYELKISSLVLERCELRSLIEKRKKRYEETLTWELPPFIGDPTGLPEVCVLDPVMRVVAMLPIVKPELKADLYGAASAPGLVEGMARVVMDASQIGEVEPGEILVAPYTAAPWTPVFSIISGVVTNTGGTLCHAVIVGREYGIPVVAGTLEATMKIKTGQRLRVDGSAGAVYILG